VLLRCLLVVLLLLLLLVLLMELLLLLRVHGGECGDATRLVHHEGCTLRTGGISGEQLQWLVVKRVGGEKKSYKI